MIFNLFKKKTIEKKKQSDAYSVKEENGKIVIENFNNRITVGNTKDNGICGIMVNGKIIK